MTFLYIALHLIAGLFNYTSEPQAGQFDFNNRCRHAYDAMLLMQFEKADSLLKVELRGNPSNLIPHYIANYRDYLVISFNENRSDYERSKSQKDLRLGKLATGDRQSPYYLFAQAEVYLQWAFINLKFENYTAAFWDIRKAFNYLTENKKKFPDFVANDKSLGVLHSLIGAVPDSYKWAIKILGFSGTIQQGDRELRNVIAYGERNRSFPFTNETRYIYSFLQLLLLNDKEGALKATESSTFPSRNYNPIACFFKGYVALKNNKNDKALEHFRFNRDVNRTTIHYNSYMLGITLLNKLDPDAEIHLADFCSRFNGSNYIKDAFLKRAWVRLLQNDTKGYLRMLDNIPNRGITLTDSDKAAQKIAKEKSIPNVLLLKARLLMDGGYYQPAMQLLAGKSAADFPKAEDKIEFTYRAGRIFQLTGNNEKALTFFNETIQRGGSLPIYFAAAAALESGNIHERQGNFEQARQFFQRCIAMPGSEQKNSIDVKAKAGLQRVSGK